MTIADIPLQNIQSKFLQNMACNVLPALSQTQMRRPQPPETPWTDKAVQPSPRFLYYLIYKTSDFLPFQHGNRSATHYFMDMTYRQTP